MPSPYLPDSSSDNKRGFTIIELLTVIAIIGILAAIIIPITGGMVERSNMAKSSSNLRQMHSGLELVVAEGTEYFPPSSYIPYGGQDTKYANWSWQDLVGEKLGFVERVDSPNAYVWRIDPAKSIFQNPGYELPFDPDNDITTSSYGYNYVTFGPDWWHSNPERNIDKSPPARKVNLKDLSRTVIIAETDGNGTADQLVWPYWAAAGVNDKYNGGGHYLFADGHVEWLEKEVVMADLDKYFRNN
ncbi:MAG: prepilin-type N-terminal cleavage/methylation domain-containing protein [Verrucomicrobiota bacterium]